MSIRIKILGIVNLIGSVAAFVFYFWQGITTVVGFAPQFPALVLAIFLLITGIITLKKRSLGFGYTGLIVLIVTILVTYLVMACISQWM
jgi:hypothetical protein